MKNHEGLTYRGGAIPVLTCRSSLNLWSLWFGLLDRLWLLDRFWFRFLSWFRLFDGFGLWLLNGFRFWLFNGFRFWLRWRCYFYCL